jgi:hypothetical protein
MLKFYTAAVQAIKQGKRVCDQNFLFLFHRGRVATSFGGHLHLIFCNFFLEIQDDGLLESDSRLLFLNFDNFQGTLQIFKFKRFERFLAFNYLPYARIRLLGDGHV